MIILLKERKTKMKEEFKLSEKVVYNPYGIDWISKRNAKEFIRLLKKYDKNKLFGNDFIVISKKDLDKLSGFEEEKNENI